MLILPFIDMFDDLSEILEGWRYLEYHYHHTSIEELIVVGKQIARLFLSLSLSAAPIA